jgi:hypothetical protein
MPRQRAGAAEDGVRPHGGGERASWHHFPRKRQPALVAAEGLR